MARWQAQDGNEQCICGTCTDATGFAVAKSFVRSTQAAGCQHLEREVYKAFIIHGEENLQFSQCCSSLPISLEENVGL